MQWPPPW